MVLAVVVAAIMAVAMVADAAIKFCLIHSSETKGRFIRPFALFAAGQVLCYNISIIIFTV